MHVLQTYPVYRDSAATFALIAMLEADEEDGWTYCCEYTVWNRTDRCMLAVYDETETLLGYL